MTNEEWETLLKSVSEEMKKWGDEEIFKIKYNIIKDIINKKESENA